MIYDFVMYKRLKAELRLINCNVRDIVCIEVNEKIYAKPVKDHRYRYKSIPLVFTYRLFSWKHFDVIRR